MIHVISMQLLLYFVFLEFVFAYLLKVFGWEKIKNNNILLLFWYINIKIKKNLTYFKIKNTLQDIINHIKTHTNESSYATDENNYSLRTPLEDET
jgi:hypothetical protein